MSQEKRHSAICGKNRNHPRLSTIRIVVEGSVPFRIRPTTWAIEVVRRHDQGDVPAPLQAVVDHAGYALAGPNLGFVEPVGEGTSTEVMLLDLVGQRTNKVFICRPVRQEDVT